MRAIILLTIGLTIMPYGPVANFGMGMGPTMASSLTPPEQEMMRADPGFEDWVRTFQPAIRAGELTRDQAIQMRKWPGSTIHNGPGPQSRRPKPRKDI
jgi:hypothetical protein